MQIFCFKLFIKKINIYKETMDFLCIHEKSIISDSIYFLGSLQLLAFFAIEVKQSKL